MSLASFLLTKAKVQDGQVVDTELNELFHSKAYAAGALAVIGDKARDTESSTGIKRKLNDEKGQRVGGASNKKARNESKSKELTQDSDSDDSDERQETIASNSEASENEGEEDSASGSDSEETDVGEESDRASSLSEPGSEEDDEGSSTKPSKIVHESLRTQKNAEQEQNKMSKKKYVPSDETPTQRDLRTIFVGNLSAEIVKKRPLQKQLRRHLLAAVPTAKIESIRFRSIPFQSATAGSSTTDASNNKTDNKDGRKHDKARAAAWREETEAKAKDEKKFLTPNQKKKIAFINQEFHSIADTVHAYVVFAYSAPTPASSSPERRPSREAKHPYEAAQIAAKQCDGTMFMDRLLRVDVVGKSSAAQTDADPKLTIFVGNLHFASKEEDLRVFIEGVISKVREGPPPQEREDADEDTAKGSVKKARTWVTRVRIVRDRETQLGKGFAYIQFADRECVDEILALEEGKLRFAKRKLRVQRCKTIPGSSVPTKLLTADTNKSATKKAKSQSKSQQDQSRKSGKQGQQAVKPSTPIVVPKGNPQLGKTLAHLSKEERKRAKAADADRVARRLAKKKARMAMGVKDKDQPGDGKKRVRVRKGTNDKVKSGKTGKGREKKGRVRSEKSLAKLNAKK